MVECTDRQTPRNLGLAIFFAAILTACSGGGGRGPAESATTAPLSSATTPTSAATPAGLCGWTPTPPRLYRHVIWIWMENHEWSQVLGAGSPGRYERSLGSACATATNYVSVGSPSLPNYIGATSGSDQGISDDASPSSHRLTVDNLFRQVRNAGGTERSYEESMTAPCQLSSSGSYAVKHNPAPYYVGNDDRAACQRDDVPYSMLARDLANDNLPTFAFVTPDLCDDTHDCSVATGDSWLAGMLPSLLASPAYRSGSSAVFVIWDEYTPMPSLFLAPSIRPATVVSAPADHYALLRTTEEMLGLPTSLGAASTATDLRPALGV